jgi:hypothetical protein
LRFIKLTEYTLGHPCYIEVGSIATLARPEGSESTYMSCVGDGNHWFSVVETPEEILCKLSKYGEVEVL